MTLLTAIGLCTACNARPQAAPTITLANSLPDQVSKYAIQGIVIGGGDKSSSSLKGGPHIFIYEVRTDGGEIILVTYTAFPPSPVGKNRVIRLDFHAGEIKIGDYLKAFGSFNPTNLTLYVEDDGDFIETFLSKP